MLVCNSIDTICFTINLDRQTQKYLMNLQYRHQLIPKGIYPIGGIVRYGWGLESDGIRIYYTDSEHLNPNCYIRFSSEYIQRVGYIKAYGRCCALLKSFGVHRPAKNLKLSQIDLAFDFQCDLSKYLDSPDYHVKTRLYKTVSRNEAEGRLVWRLWGVGASNGYKVRVYDKLQESFDVDGKEYWHEIWTNQGFFLDGPIWRIEYELRRDFLKQWKIDRFSQFLDAQLAIQKRLFGLWSIVCNDKTHLEHKNYDRMKHVSEFEYLIEHFTEPFREHEVDLRPESYEKAAEQQIIKALNALVSSITNRAAAFFSRKKGKRVLEIDAYLREGIGKFCDLVESSVLAYPEKILEAVTDLLDKKGIYFTPAHGMLEVAHA